MKIIIPIVITLLIIGGAYYYWRTNDDLKDKVEETEKEVIEEVIKEDDIKDFYEERLLGKWKSISDERSVLLFQKDGVFSDIYDNEVIGTGKWNTEIIMKQFNVIFYIYKELDGERYEYELLNVDDHNLSLLYLGRGNILEYTKVNN